MGLLLCRHIAHHHLAISALLHKSHIFINVPAQLIYSSPDRATLSVRLVGFGTGDDVWRRSAGRSAETQ